MTQPAQSPASKAYQDEIINGALNDFLSKSKEVGGLVAEHVSQIAHIWLLTCSRLS